MGNGSNVGASIQWIVRIFAWCGLLFLSAVSMLNLWPQMALELLPLHPAGWTGHLTFSPAHSYLGWNSYQNQNHEEAAEWLRMFNAWQPTQDSLLLEGRCAFELGRRDTSRTLYKKVTAFDPRSRQARLALIDLDLKEILSLETSLEPRIDEILDLIPWDDASSIAKICDRLLTLADSRPGKPRLTLVAAVLYLDPADLIFIRKAGVQLLQESDPEIRRMGADLVITTLLAERSRLSEKDIQRLDLLLPGDLSLQQKDALIQGRFSRVSTEEMIARTDPLGSRSKTSSDADPYPICLEKEWHRQLGWSLRHYYERP